MALSACLLLDPRSDRVVRELWARLEQQGIGTLLSHTHRHHRPHLSLASLLEWETEAVVAAVEGLGGHEPVDVRLEGLGMFRRSRCWLAPSASPALLVQQREVVDALRRTGAALHRHYEPTGWTPHVTLAPRLHLGDLAVVARHTFEVLPVDVLLDRLALVDTSTGRLVWASDGSRAGMPGGDHPSRRLEA